MLVLKVEELQAITSMFEGWIGVLSESVDAKVNPAEDSRVLMFQTQNPHGQR